MTAKDGSTYGKVVGLALAGVLLLASCAPTAQPVPAPPSAPALAAPTPAPVASPAPPATPRPAVAAPTPTPPPVAIPRRGGFLRWAQGDEPPNLDLLRVATGYGPLTLSPTVNGLLDWRADDWEKNYVAPALAERWEASTDGLRYTFYLRKGVKWHDGTPFTAKDVKFTFDRIKNPAKGETSPRKDSLEAVERVETPDDLTVVVYLSRPSASFLGSVTAGWIHIYPSHVPVDKFKTAIIGTGPFKLDSYERNVRYSFTRNDSYFLPGRPYLDGMEVFIIRDSATRLAALRVHKTNTTGRGTVGTLTGSEARELERTVPGFKTRAHDRLLPWSVMINSSVKPWSDPRVRRAVHLALDRKSFIETAFYGAGGAGGYVSPSGQWSLPTEELAAMPGVRAAKDQDRVRARQLLAEAGYPDGFDAALITLSATSFWQAGAVVLVDELKKIGIRAQLQAMERTAWFDALYAGRFQISWGARSADDDDPDRLYFAHYYSKGGENFGRFVDRELDGLIERQSRTLDPQERRKMVLDIERKMLTDLVPWVSVVWHYDIPGWWPEVKGLVMGAGNYVNLRYDDIWIGP